MQKLKSMNRKKLCIFIAEIFCVCYLFSALLALMQYDGTGSAPLWLILCIKGLFYLLPAVVFALLAMFNGRKSRKK